MNKTLLALLGLAIIGLIEGGCRNKKKGQPDTDGYFISTQSQSDNRVKALNLDKPSEDASYILDTNKLAIPKGKHAGSSADTAGKNKAIDEFNQGALVILKCDTPLKGELVWDVLQSVGLKWGDGDLFHWENHNHDYGDDQFFSVWTTTNPGYFLPESIKNGQMNPGDLLFGFSVPRNADPQNVFSVMIEAVKYCRKRLGGKILNKNLQPFNEDSAKKDLALLIVKMKNKGIVPGSDKALMMY